MLSKWSWIVLNLIVYVTTAPHNATLPTDEATAFFELIELDYEDMCYNIANVEWSFVVSPSNKTLLSWELQQYHYAQFIKMQKNEVIHKIENTKMLESSIQYKYNVIEKPGDALIKDKDWKKLVHLAGIVELQRSVSHVNRSENCSREDVEYLLSHNGKLENKQAAWNDWYSQLTPLVTNYSNNLLLVVEAAKENGVENVQEYWEMLSGYPGGYKKIKNGWNLVNSIHKKIVKFLNTNLAEKYNITINDTLPAYLLGSLQGYDWTDISSDILPYSESIYDIKKNLWKKRCLGKSLYKTASNLGFMLLKQVPQAEFWDKSEFNKKCPSKLLNFCKDGTMKVSTCSKATINNFVTAHEDVGKILFNQMTVESTPVLNTINRHSVLEESISTLFGILSVSPAWLNRTNLINDIEQEERMIISLMITALNILPRLSYYYSADLWRLNAIERNITDPAELVASWWKYRQEYELVSASTESPTFLDDSHIVKNKPYLPKILGMMLAFQLYERIMDSNEVRYSLDEMTFAKGSIIKMIQNGGAVYWKPIVETFANIYDISVDPLYSYFMPLEEEIEFNYVSGAQDEKEIEELERHILREINNPTTTPTPTTTTTTTTTTTNRITTASPSLYKITSNEKNMQSKVEKSSESKSSVHVREEKPTNLKSDLLGQPNPTQISSDKSSLATEVLNNGQDDAPKINTSKAVWAVSAVLIAIVVICIIAIFGRRRCRKTPKNRR